ncbi:thiol:disulfide interchange protein [Vibrio sp. HA2012]|uniref:thiol:disulfide interchange protein DsbA/DsbL n=1 Tax=Vibrio sp. HA2012 TaxID=1971595 RepID=UPI000C2C9D46|nr:thiol:disulfide interchange protein DsbA/DsbL [Vibrio sp. HA2012]PJC85153.1 thiol:disulfide interchange protein [Vibrio sp. HA2012]
MKKLFALIAAMIVSVSVQATEFKPGTHYTILNTQASSSPKVTEYFSFYCPHCFKFEPFMQVLKENLPANASFQKSHVTFMGKAMGIPMAKAYATMVILKQEENLVPAMFRQVQELRTPPRNEAELRQWFIDHGVNGELFDNTYNSFAIDSMQKRFVKDFDDAELRGVPGVVVNDKYVVEMEWMNNYETNQERIDVYIELVNYLLKK